MWQRFPELTLRVESQQRSHSSRPPLDSGSSLRWGSAVPVRPLADWWKEVWSTPLCQHLRSSFFDQSLCSFFLFLQSHWHRVFLFMHCFTLLLLSDLGDVGKETAKMMVRCWWQAIAHWRFTCLRLRHCWVKMSWTPHDTHWNILFSRHVDQGKHVQISLKLLFAISSVESTDGDIALKESPNGWTPVAQGFLSGILLHIFSTIFFIYLQWGFCKKTA